MGQEKQNLWQLTDKGRAIIADILRNRNETQERIQRLTPPCPVEGLPGEFFRSVGSGITGRVSFQYRCSNNDIFGWDFTENVSYLISSSPQGSTPRDAK